MNKNGNFYCGFWIVANVIIFDLVHFDTALNSMSAVWILVVGMSTFHFFFTKTETQDIRPQTIEGKRAHRSANTLR